MQRSRDNPRARSPAIAIAAAVPVSVLATVLAGVALSICVAVPACGPARAQGPDRGDEGAEAEGAGTIDAWARAIAEGTMPRWTGARVPLRPSAPRPELDGYVARSALWPVAVHAERGVDPGLVDRALAALEDASAWMDEEGWGEAPPPDGARGGGDGLDVYLLRGGQRAADARSLFDLPELAPGEPDDALARAVHVGWDAPVAWAPLDAVTTFATIDLSRAPLARGDGAALAACVASAYAQARIAAQDPAEAPAWRRALGAFVAWQVTGSFGCSEDAIEAAQARPERGLVTHAPGSGEIGALLLGAISARHDGGSGAFVRDLVQGARQWTWEGEGWRAEPDVWHAITHFLSLSRQPLGRLLEDVAVARWFTGSRAGLGAHAVPVMRDAPGEVPLAGRVEWARLPRTPVRGEVELEPQGSAYVLADVRGAPEGSRLRVWLRGEYGVGWSMVAVRLDAQGRELGRMRAPVRREPRAYLPVELDERVALVLVVVTNLSWRRPDADEPDENVRAFRLTLDRARDGE